MTSLFLWFYVVTPSTLRRDPGAGVVVRGGDFGRAALECGSLGVVVVVGFGFGETAPCCALASRLSSLPKKAAVEVGRPLDCFQRLKGNIRPTFFFRQFFNFFGAQ